APVCSRHAPTLSPVAALHAVSCLMHEPGSGHPRAMATPARAA
ncbi:MAG: dipeptide/oligopeptide/nickel ABC transporter ATP-binding protein, partial [Variovorax paradoxus]